MFVRQFSFFSVSIGFVSDLLRGVALQRANGPVTFDWCTQAGAWECFLWHDY
jgi:hypothetical protein